VQDIAFTLNRRVGFYRLSLIHVSISLLFSPLLPIDLNHLPLSASSDIVLAAEELRYAAKAVGRVTGEIGTEDVLDALFKGFCIGK